MSVRLHFRDLRTCDVHPRARASVLTLPSNSRGVILDSQQISVQQVEVCGSRVALSIRSFDTFEMTTDLFVVDWILSKMKNVSFLPLLA